MIIWERISSKSFGEIVCNFGRKMKRCESWKEYCAKQVNENQGEIFGKRTVQKATKSSWNKNKWTTTV